MGRGTNSSSSSSSIDSSHHPSFSSASSLSQPQRDLSTDLRLGLDISNSPSSSREQSLDWPPIKPELRRSLLAEGNNKNHETLFVKVYMEGIPIGRKLDLLAHDDYKGLIRTLDPMFGTTILRAEEVGEHSERYHVLTYEDKEGDWLIVGDVPWEMFVTSVKRLKITQADKC